MFIGVMSYSYAIGSLSSVLSSLDSKDAKLKQKLSTLEEFNRDYKISPDLYIRLKKAVKYDNSRDETEKFQLLKQLPHSVKIELSYLMHKNTDQKNAFFQKQDPSFMAFCLPLLKPCKILQGEYIYMEGDPINESNKIFKVKFTL